MLAGCANPRWPHAANQDRQRHRCPCLRPPVHRAAPNEPPLHAIAPPSQQPGRVLEFDLPNRPIPTHGQGRSPRCRTAGLVENARRSQNLPRGPSCSSGFVDQSWLKNVRILSIPAIGSFASLGPMRRACGKPLPALWATRTTKPWTQRGLDQHSSHHVGPDEEHRNTVYRMLLKHPWKMIL